MSSTSPTLNHELARGVFLSESDPSNDAPRDRRKVMKRMAIYHRTLWSLGFLGLSALALRVAPADEPKATDAIPPSVGRQVEFDREVRPIFTKSCYRCHGPKGQKGGLRLHVKAAALAGGDNGPAIEPGKGAESRLIRFVAGVEEDHVMPPDGAGERLTAEQIGILRAWIDQGAPWPDSTADAKTTVTDHWAFQKPVRPELPAVKNTAWPRTAIDRFILARLEKEGLSPSAEAERTTLIRRLYLDLIGLPPSPAEIDAFLADTRPDAYEKLVDHLIDSPHYGERWGRRWLDRARYADTNGYEKDRERSIWPYRDWVINALNADMPFDRFTIEQIAGDLLPNATTDQNVATGFHRNTMINEEGGIDVEEFRFASLVDRVATTGTVWLGLTIQCAQCHTHKFDPITQREYYQFLAFFNNADEPDLDLFDPAVKARRDAVEVQAAALEADLENQFPAYDPPKDWQTLETVRATSSEGATLSPQSDGSILVSGPVPETDTYVVVAETDVKQITSIRVEALTDESLPSTGPGRTPHGNFVLDEVKVTAAPKADDAKAVPIQWAGAEADFSQKGFDAAGAIDGNSATGWAIDDASGHLNKNRVATFKIKEKVGFDGGTRLTITLSQRHGTKHTLGRFRLSVPRPDPAESDASRSLAEKRRDHLQAKMATWEKSIAAVHWTPLAPSRVTSKKHATMSVLADRSVLVTGDKPNNDIYEVDVSADLKGITGLRLEVLPDASLPDGGPGRAPLFSVGDFILTELNATLLPANNTSAAQPIVLQNATQDYAEEGRSAALAIDGVPDTGWTVKGGVGKPHAAVFEVKEDLNPGPGAKLRLTLTQFGIHQMTIGRFRISATTDPRPVRASGVPDEIESILLVPGAARTEAQAKQLKRYYLSVATELNAEHKKIAALRKSAPAYVTSMVMQERDPSHARTTHVHKRGEFLKTTVEVAPELPAVFPPLPSDAPKNRLTIARWLVSEDNPLVGRVIMNQVWQAYFGRGLVATIEDFGTRGDRPTHPELLDWLATEFPRQGWSLKAMHRLIVTSATYRQSSRVTPELLARDPKNELLARGPRFRVEAEVVRDIALAASGLLNPKVGGPSVYPPQPEGVTALAYGMTAWPTSSGAERYRRGLYTYTKRATPYAAFAILDAPSSETACVRRERSNTPLQALTLLNDTVFVEASRSLAARVLSEAPKTTEERIRYACRLVLGRTPKPEESTMLTGFLDKQLARFRAGETEAAKVAGIDPKAPPARADVPELASWTIVARALLNLDETVTKE